MDVLMIGAIREADVKNDEISLCGIRIMDFFD